MEKPKEPNLSINSITFGKYKNSTVEDLIKDRKYCSWLLDQDWFKTQYEFIYNRVKDSDPKKYFINKKKYDIGIEETIQHFLDNYEYFSLTPLQNLSLPLKEDEKICYSFYIESIDSLKNKILNNLGEKENVYDIKAPSSWLKNFEKKYTLPRTVFKDFLSSYELPNITTIVEDIKRHGGLEYKGAKSFKIAKSNSLKQEKYWETILKKYYGEDIGVQFKFGNCIFDFVNIKRKVLFECKLGLKDFDSKQYEKYMTVLNCFTLVYLIGENCILDMGQKIVFTTNADEYRLGICKIENKICDIVKNYTIVELDKIEEYFDL
jgi:hypothetical protein